MTEFIMWLVCDTAALIPAFKPFPPQGGLNSFSTMFRWAFGLTFGLTLESSQLKCAYPFAPATNG
jgi:hypothetical protein